MIVHTLIDHGRDSANCIASNTTGASGVRIYQCVVGIANDADQVGETRIFVLIWLVGES